MSLEEITSPKAPQAVGPYSPAVKAGNLLFCSGQIAINPPTGELIQNSIEEETKQVMENLKNILEEAGCGFSNVVKTDIFVTDMNNYAKVNEIYGSYFTQKPLPARATVEVSKLPKGARVEISCIAIIG